MLHNVKLTIIDIKLTINDKPRPEETGGIRPCGLHSYYNAILMELWDFSASPPPLFFFGGEGRMVTHSNLVAILLSICHMFIALIKLVRYLKYRISVTVYTTNYSTCVNYIILSFKHCFWQVDINV